MKFSLKSFTLIVSLLAVSPASAWELKITRPEVSGPVRLVCLNPEGLQEHVKRLTRMQIIGIRAAAHDREVKWPCDDVQIPVGSTVIHTRWLKTSDGWWIQAETIQYPGGSVMVTANPFIAQFGRKPIEFRLRCPTQRCVKN